MNYNVLHLNFSNSGGAGLVAQTLSDYQKKLINFESQFIYKIEGTITNNFLGNIDIGIRAGIDNFILKKYTTPSLYSCFRNVENFTYLELLKRHQGIIHLHWVNGLLNSSSIQELVTKNKKLVWTIHDMEPFTGGCHHSLDCDKYTKTCHNCPILHIPFAFASHNQLKEKLIDFPDRSKISYVFPSKWLRDKFEKSSFGSSISGIVIPNPIDQVFFNAFRDSNVPREDKFVVGFVAQNLNDPFKQFQIALRLIKNVASKVSKPIEVLAVGSIDLKKINTYGLNLNQTNVVISRASMAEIYAKMDLLISTSQAESFGLTIAEAGAAGTPSLVLGRSGSAELITDSQTGFIAEDEQDFLLKLELLINNASLLFKFHHNIHRFAKSRWHIDKISVNYEDVYQE